MTPIPSHHQLVLEPGQPDVVCVDCMHHNDQVPCQGSLLIRGADRTPRLLLWCWCRCWCRLQLGQKGEDRVQHPLQEAGRGSGVARRRGNGRREAGGAPEDSGRDLQAAARRLQQPVKNHTHLAMYIMKGCFNLGIAAAQNLPMQRYTLFCPVPYMRSPALQACCPR